MFTIDWLLIAAYFAVIFATVIPSLRSSKSGPLGSSNYFLAGRNAGWFVIGASLFASNIGSEHLVGLAGSGAAGGVAVAQFEILGSLILLLLGWLFVPFYLRSQVFTMPEFLERRFSPTTRWYLAIVSIISYVLTKISVTIAAGGIIFEALMGIDFWLGSLVVVIATGIYTSMGGLRAVLYTDVLQMFILIGSSVLVTIIGLDRLGGLEPLRQDLGQEFFNLWKPSSHPDFPWTGILFGAPILGTWYWCTDQFIVQRVLAARDIRNARAGTIWAGWLKILPLFIFVFPGLIAQSLALRGEIVLQQPDQALPALISHLLPPGLRGLAVAGLLAALMSSLSSVFNSCSTLITFDIYKKLRPEDSEKNLVLAGKISTAALIGLGLLWIPLMGAVSGRIFQYIQSIQAYISPPIASVFLFGICWQRINAQGAISSLVVGFILGTLRLILEINKTQLEGSLLTFATINFLHFAFFLFVICTIVLIVVSLATKPPRTEQITDLTFQSSRRARSQHTDQSHTGWFTKEVIWSWLLCLGVGATWMLFSG